MAARQLKVLIVEDELELQTSLNRLLRHLEQEMEATIEWTSSADSAMSCIARSRYDLIIIDQHLPGHLTGFEFWKKATRTCNAGYVIMSGISIGEYLGMIGDQSKPPLFLKKPFTIDEFKSVVSAALNSVNRNSQERWSI